jgi:hypothetical protein
MGFVIAHGACIACGQVFGFNPNRVPSSSAVTGKREPLCQACVNRLNVIRTEKGLPPIVPLPGAYAPADEYEIDWND